MENTEPLPRTRRLALAGPVDPAALERLAASPGLLGLRPLAGGMRLEITYDLRRLTWPEVESLLRAAGAAPSRGLLAGWARAWAAFQDDNRRDQSRIVHQCCNTPPRPKQPH